MSVPRKKRKAAYHHGNLRQGLIACGVELIQEKGVDALTLREIGARLGVSRSAAYRHFADKAALVAAITEAGFIEFGDALEGAKSGAAPDFSSRMQAMGAAYIRFANEHRAYFDVIFAGPLEPGSAAAQAGDRAFGILEETIREGQASGDVRRGDSSVLARTVWAWVHGVSMLRLDASEPGFFASSFEILRSGLSGERRGPIAGAHGPVAAADHSGR